MLSRQTELQQHVKKEAADSHGWEKQNNSTTVSILERLRSSAN